MNAHLTSAALYTRVKVRLARGRLRRLKGRIRPAGVGHSPLPLAVTPVAGRSLLLRPPQLSDADRYAAVLLAHADDLADQHPQPAGSTDPWSADEALLSWTDRLLTERAQARRGERFVELLLLSGQLVGEVSARIDHGTSSADLTLWVDAPAADGVSSRLVAERGMALFLLHIGQAAHPPRRYFSEVPERVEPATGDEPATGGELDRGALLESLGFHREGRLLDSRLYRGRPAAHDIWVAHDTDVFRRNLQAILDQA
ncbi:hypothetical protein SAMN05892883_4408 [Jatrophihabitans sp. GAS493]|uniref:GNAT family N-acetyltransferase n=1 Tax=Jatrophihabitans sp. GAS493 TaxID=1907575 RepID=UPI000BB851C3|nr:hypothetical protein [Jatrophihabitans sp. GAS493]SOD75201.1 hypothetical protein SAMN05892883_4408 [Jatrophihabitans sp. GAS493]